MDYNAMHCKWANIHKPVKGRKVLVVGCNTGLDCKTFVDLGASTVDGLDIDVNTGCDFSHERVQYFRASAEKMPFQMETYDLVFSFATLEHVPNVTLAFQEMARVTKPGGLIYSIASPLWNSKYGHHFPQYFSSSPWIHLRCDQASILNYLEDNKIPIDDANIDSNTVAEYIFQPENFNRTCSSKYLKSCSDLVNLNFLKNDVDVDVLTPELKPYHDECVSLGFKSEDLLSVTHTLIAIKKTKPFSYSMPLTSSFFDHFKRRFKNLSVISIFFNRS